MQKLDLTVDYNGIVLFNPAALAGRFGGSIEAGTNVLEQLQDTTAGDVVVAAGIALPILGINDSTYEFHIRLATEPSEVDSLCILENGVFPLQVSQRLVIADLAVLVEWADELGWKSVDVAAGTYGVTIRGFRAIEGGRVVRFGYEAVFEPRDSLPAMSGSLVKDMQVLTLR